MIESEIRGGVGQRQRAGHGADRDVLGDPVRLGELHLPGRIVVLSPERAQASSGGVSGKAGFGSRVGMVVAGRDHPVLTSPVPQADRQCPSEGHQVQRRGIAGVEHSAGAAVVMSLAHPGGARSSIPSGEPSGLVASASAALVPPAVGRSGAAVLGLSPLALSVEEIGLVVDGYRRAAMDAVSTGMDGVELDASADHLPMQFLSTGSNLRQDAYGASSWNRCRFVREVMQAMREAIGPGRVGIRIDPAAKTHGIEDAVPSATYAALLRGLSDTGFAYVHLRYRPMRSLDTLALTRGYWSGPVILGGDIDAARAGCLVASGAIDAVVLES